jgi:hypothetical protein
MIARVLLLGSAALLLAGCFDGHYDLGLNNDGSGRIAIQIVLDKDLSRDILKEGKGGKDKLKSESDLGKNAHTSQHVENGSIVIDHSLDFKSLAEITGGDVDVEVRSTGHTGFGATRSVVRFATSSSPKKSGKPDADEYGAQIMDQMFKGHEMRVTMHLPCVVENANTIFDPRNKAAYAPTIDKSWFRGSTVEWRLPMAVALTPEQHSPRNYIATCWSYSGITPGRSQSK